MRKKRKYSTGKLNQNGLTTLQPIGGCAASVQVRVHLKSLPQRNNVFVCFKQITKNKCRIHQIPLLQHTESPPIATLRSAFPRSRRPAVVYVQLNVFLSPSCQISANHCTLLLYMIDVAYSLEKSGTTAVPFQRFAPRFSASILRRFC